MKRANLIINILIYFFARGYVSAAAFMNFRGGASSFPHIRPCVPPIVPHRGIQREKARRKSNRSMRAVESAKNEKI
jgi:hypothetical protein